jgi:hypothetical protein
VRVSESLALLCRSKGHCGEADSMSELLGGEQEDGHDVLPVSPLEMARPRSAPTGIHGGFAAGQDGNAALAEWLSP